MTEIIDLAEIRLANAKPPLKPPPILPPDLAIGAVREALDLLADACVVAGLFWPTSADEWANIAKAGLHNRLERRAEQ